MKCCGPRAKHSFSFPLLVMTGAVFALWPMNLIASDHYSERDIYSSGNFGGIGLLEMRNARFAPDGSLSVGFTYQDQFRRYFATWQATPWLETTLSYTDFRPEDSGQNHPGVDRSFDIKLRLMEEGDYRPSLAVGIQDGLGNGLFGGEYIVASKRYYSFDFTAGLGWGYLGQRNQIYNIFRVFSSSFGERNIEGDSSGKIRLDTYFSGQKISLFGGIEYQTPVEGLSLKVEYNGAKTRTIEALAFLQDKSAFNFGINYKATPWLDLALGFDRGDAVTFRLVLKQNLHKISPHKISLGNFAKERPPAEIMVRGTSDAATDEIISNSLEISQNKKLFDHLQSVGFYVKETGFFSGVMKYRVEIRKDKKPDNIFALGAILQFHEKAEVIIEDKGQVIARLKASRDDSMGKLALGRFSRSPAYIREQVSRNEPINKNNEIAKNTLEALEAEGLKPLSVLIKSNRVVINKSAGPFRNIAKNIGRTARILTSEMPDHIEAFTIISKENDARVSKVTLLRKDLEKAKEYKGSPEEIWANADIVTPNKVINGEQNDHRDGGGFFEQKIYPYFEWALRPDVVTHFGGNEDGKFRADVSAKLFGKVNVNSHFGLTGVFKQHIAGDIDQIPLKDNADVPAVRSDVALYSAQGRTALEKLQLDYIHSPATNLYTRLSAGLFEGMFAGIGGEMLYRPYDKNLAVGIDLNWVKQRDYTQLFSFRNYDVLSGHVSLYHENIKYNITSTLSVGRYLAGDFGGTFDISRRFANGIRIGLWATYTDMNSQIFGEGSFDKGIYMKLPLDMFWSGPTRDNLRIDFRRLGKNGGQRLTGSSSLYDMLSAGQKNRLKQDWHNILE